MSIAPLIALAAEEPVVAGVNKWAVGGLILLVLFAAMAGLVAFGAGRDHS